MDLIANNSQEVGNPIFHLLDPEIDVLRGRRVIGLFHVIGRIVGSFFFNRFRWNISASSLEIIPQPLLSGDSLQKRRRYIT
jgi:hypothetical protein